jgi:hypothetical protein
LVGVDFFFEAIQFVVEMVVSLRRNLLLAPSLDLPVAGLCRLKGLWEPSKMERSLAPVDDFRLRFFVIFVFIFNGVGDFIGFLNLAAQVFSRLEILSFIALFCSCESMNSSVALLIAWEVAAVALIVLRASILAFMLRAASECLVFSLC